MHSKIDTKHIIGTAGVRNILDSIPSNSVKTVAIGGLKASNVQRVLFQSRGESRSLDGVAVVSAIMAATDPKSATTNMVSVIKEPPAFYSAPPDEAGRPRDLVTLLARVTGIVRKVDRTGPLSQLVILKI